MKTVHIPMDDEDYEKLIKAKGGKSWLEFIMPLTRTKNGKNNCAKNNGMKESK